MILAGTTQHTAPFRSHGSNQQEKKTCSVIDKAKHTKKRYKQTTYTCKLPQNCEEQEERCQCGRHRGQREVIQPFFSSPQADDGSGGPASSTSNGAAAAAAAAPATVRIVALDKIKKIKKGYVMVFCVSFTKR